MSGSRGRDIGGKGNVTSPREANEGQYMSGREMRQPRAATGANSLPQQMSNLSMQQPVFNIFVTQQFNQTFYGDVVNTTNIQDSQVGSVGGQLSTQSVSVQPPTGLSETELHSVTASAITSLLGGLNLPESEQIIRALERSETSASPHRTKGKGDVDTKTKKQSRGDINLPTESVIEKISAMKLDEDECGKHLEEAFVALISGDNSKKSTLDLVDTYKKESASVSPSLLTEYLDLEETVTKMWLNYFLGVVTNTSNRYFKDGDEMRCVLARISGYLSKQLQKQINYQEHKKNLALHSRAGDVFRIGEIFSSSNKPIHAIFAFYTAAELYELENSGENSVDDVMACAYQIFAIAQQVAGQHSVIQQAIELTRKIRPLLGTVDELTQPSNIESDAWCLFFIAGSYFLIGKYDRSVTELHSAIELLKTAFKEKASNFRIYGHCLRNAGGAYFQTGDISKAFESVKLAVLAFENADDWLSDEDKEDTLRTTRENLKRCISLIQK